MDTIYKIFEMQSHTWLYPFIFLISFANGAIEYKLAIYAGEWATNESITEDGVYGITNHAIKVIGMVLLDAGINIVND